MSLGRNVEVVLETQRSSVTRVLATLWSPIRVPSRRSEGLKTSEESREYDKTIEARKWDILSEGEREATSGDTAVVENTASSL